MNYTGIRVVSNENVNVGGIVGAITGETITLLANTEYMLQFKIINYSHNTILDHIVSIKDGVSNLITSSLDILEFPIVNIFKDEGIIKNERLCYVKFVPPSDGKYKFGICRTFKENDTQSSVLFDIRHLSCERGIILQDFKDNSNDLVEFMRKCETYFEQNDKRILMMAKQEDINTTSAKIDIASDNILIEVRKKVSADNIIASINMSPENIQISANLIDMTGKLDLNGTFKCYRDGSNKTGHYLYQSGAMHRGYLEGSQNPTFSSGIWRPDGVNDMGYVSVGWTNSDHIDENGCLWMSPIAGGGAHLIYSKLLSPGVGSVSGITYHKGGSVEYHAALGASSPETIGHVFDCSVAANGYFKSEGIYSSGDVLTLSYGNKPINTYAVHLQHEGYMYPSGNTQLGTSANPWYTLLCRYAPQVVSDARQKKDIQYIKDTTVMTLDLNEDVIDYTDKLTTDDMYSFIKDDLKLATYKLIDSKLQDKDKTEIGFIIQDIKDTKVGKYITNTQDENNYTYDMGNRISVLEGALKKAINKIEELEQKLI